MQRLPFATQKLLPDARSSRSAGAGCEALSANLVTADIDALEAR